LDEPWNTRRRGGFFREVGGHGIGRTIHEPRVPNYLDTQRRQVLTEGMVITVEPIIAAGNGQVFVAMDGWTVRTVDGKPLRTASTPSSIRPGRLCCH
jgi:methionine aminopeptidase